MDTLKHLNKRHRQLVLLRAYKLLFNQYKQYWLLPKPVSFAIKTTVLTFSLLAILPHHPLTLPTALGGALSISLVCQI